MSARTNPGGCSTRQLEKDAWLPGVFGKIPVPDIAICSRQYIRGQAESDASITSGRFIPALISTTDET
jgi:hypothetical protein